MAGGEDRLDFKVFHDIMKVLGDWYPRFDLTKDRLTAYYVILHDLDEQLLRAATIEWGAKDTPWPPSAGQLRQMCFDIVDRAAGRLTAGDAWGKALKAVGEHGIYRGEPDWEEPAIASGIAAVGGWRALCMTPEESQFSARARFSDGYNAARQQERANVAMLPQVRDVVERLSGSVRALPEGE